MFNLALPEVYYISVDTHSSQGLRNALKIGVLQEQRMSARELIEAVKLYCALVCVQYIYRIYECTCSTGTHTPIPVSGSGGGGGGRVSGVVRKRSNFSISSSFCVRGEASWSPVCVCA